MSSRSLDDLPEEIVLEIVEYLQGMFIRPHYYGLPPISIDIWHLALCSKRFQRIAVPILYHTVHLPGLRIVERFLETIIEYPTYAPLVKACKYAPETGENEEAQVIDLSKASKIHKLAPELIEVSREGNAWTHGLLLPFLLPNLESFKISPHFNQKEERCFQLHFSRLLGKGLGWTKLRSFSWIVSQPLNITTLISVLSLPSLTKLCVRGQIDSGNNVVYQHRTSSVEELKLRDAKIAEENLSILLRVLQALKKFRYYQVAIRASDAPTPQGFIHALEAVSNSLERLDVVMVWHMDTGPSSGSAFLSFDKFASLNTLLINYQLVYGPDPNSAPCIANSLPKALEVLAMRLFRDSKWTEDIVPDIWKRLLLKKSSTDLSRLRVIGHVTNWKLYFLSPN
ncbi:hypothetical protein CPB86DRAFT_876810 [Serendipita vermifera]|nr:hypothetical protein CPB86DRAFT_876810 [Serendipita vermifera]